MPFKKAKTQQKKVKVSYLPCWKLELVHCVSLVLSFDEFFCYHRTIVKAFLLFLADCNSIFCLSKIEDVFSHPFEMMMHSTLLLLPATHPRISRLIFLLMLKILRQESQQTDEGTHVDDHGGAKRKAYPP